MKNKIFAIFIAVLLLICLTTTLVACDREIRPDDPDYVDERATALKGLTDQIIVSSNQAWSSNMPKENVVLLKDAGDYYAVSSWATFASEVIDKSELQTSKIGTITAYVASDKGKELLAGDETEMLDVFQSIGLTSTDTENIVYTALVLFLEKGDQIYGSAMSNINALPFEKMSSETSFNIRETMAILQAGKKMFDNAVVDRQNAITALKNAESGVKTIVSFVFNNSQHLNNDTNKGLLDKISSGTLAGATTGEIATYMGAILDSIQEVGTSLEGQAESLCNALQQVISVYEKLVVDNEVLNGIFKFVSDNRNLPTMIPAIAKLAGNAEKIALDTDNSKYPFVEDIMTLLGDGYAYEGDSASANEYVAYARMVLALLGIDRNITDGILHVKQTGQAKTLVKTIVDGMLGEGSSLTKKEAVTFWASLHLESPSDTMIGEINVVRICGIWFVDELIYPLFKKQYIEHSTGIADNRGVLSENARTLMKFVTGTTVDVGTTFNDEWYNNICSQFEAKLTSEVGACYPHVKADIDKRVDNFFNDAIDELIEIACMEPVKVDDAGYEAFEEKVEELYLVVMSTLLPLEMQ